MSAPLVPSPLDYIGRKQFAFYPPIRHATPNSWVLGSSSWSEVQVINAQTGRELWIPRRYVGAVSDSSDNLVVGVTQQLDLRDGEVVLGGNRRVIEMPFPKDAGASLKGHGPALVIGIRLEKETPTTFQKAPFRVGIALLFVAGLLALVESASR
jgi:hypothetical protein